MALTQDQKRALELYKKQKNFNRNSKSQKGIVMSAPQGHKPNSPYINLWERLKGNCNADMLWALGAVQAKKMSEKEQVQFRKSVPRKSTKKTKSNSKKTTKAKGNSNKKTTKGNSKRKPKGNSTKKAGSKKK